MIKAKTLNGYLISIPKYIRNYKCLKVLGCGCTSIVVLTEDQNTKQKWAAKVISIEDVKSRKLLHSIEKEIAILQELDHPNIIKMREFFEIEKEYIVIIMEYCERGDLLTLTTKKKLKDEKIIKKIIFGFLDAVKYLHSRYISHGDIKADNILITEANIPKICDFGFCRTTYVAGNESKYGTLFYVAPELFEKGEFDPFKTDIYAIGITLYTIFELHYPFKNGDDREIVKQIKNSDLWFEFNKSLKLEKVIKKCTDKEPSNRPTIEEIINCDYLNADENKSMMKNNNLVNSNKSNY